MTSQTMTLQTHEGPMAVFVVSPEGVKGPRPALIVLQEAFGVNHHIKEICQRLASEGYVAAAPELFHRAGQGIDIAYTDFPKARPIMGELTNDRLNEDVAVTLRYLQSLPQVDPKKVGAIGFCMGGFTALLAACRLPLKLAVSYYGGGITKERPGIGFSPLLSEFPHIKCPVLLVYGEEDHSISAEDITLTGSALEAAHTDHEIRVYPRAGHGFLCNERASYQAEAARVSWQETMSWISQKMK